MVRKTLIKAVVILQWGGRCAQFKYNNDDWEQWPRRRRNIKGPGREFLLNWPTRIFAKGKPRTSTVGDKELSQILSGRDSL